jgi:L-lactate dehydrogenase complex protein LldG
MATKDEMLRRVRNALGRAESAKAESAPPTHPDFPPLGAVLAPVPPEKLVDKFEEELEKVGGIAHRASLPLELEQILQEIVTSAGNGPVVLSRNPLLQRLGIPVKLANHGYPVVVWPDQGRAVDSGELERFRGQCFDAKVGITGVDYALTESGSLVLTSRTEGCQLASLAPPVHIALYRRSQVVETLEEVLRGLTAASDRANTAGGRSVVMITGQSRTADIEQVSIRGVHGPLNLHAILVEESSLTSASPL